MIIYLNWFVLLPLGYDLNTEVTRQAVCYNLTLWRVRVNIVAVKNSKYYVFWVCVCRLRYPACSAHAPYCRLWPIWLCNTFPHYLVNGNVFFKKLLNKICVLVFSTNFVWNISHSKKSERDMIKNVNWSTCKGPVILVTFYWNLHFLVIYSKNSQTSNFTRIRTLGAELFHADRRTEKSRQSK